MSFSRFIAAAAFTSIALSALFASPSEALLLLKRLNETYATSEGARWYAIFLIRFISEVLFVGGAPGLTDKGLA